MNLKVISFNLRFRSDPDGNSIPERAPRLKTVLSKYIPDVIGFQEYTPEWEPFIKEYYGKEYEIFNKYRNDPEGTPILWRKDKFKCLKKGYFWLSDTPEKKSRGWDELLNCSRICLYAVLRDRASGKIFTFMNTHFGFGDRGQTLGARLLYDYMGKISQFPTFITGDFNMTPESKGYAVMTKFFTDVNAVTSNDRRDTYHGYTPDVGKNQHIDYCFASEGIIPVGFKIIDDVVEGRFPSDHWGICADLKVYMKG